MLAIKVLPIGIPWPSVGYVESALLAISEVELEERISTGLARGTEEGLGAWAAIGLQLPSGAIVELVNYRERPGESAFIVRTIPNALAGTSLNELVSCLGLTERSIIWRRANAVA